MNVIQTAAVIADIPKAAMLGNAGKKNLPVGEKKDKMSFSDVLNAASGSSSNSDKPIDDGSNTQTIEPVQQQYLTILVPLFQLNTANTANTTNTTNTTVSIDMVSDNPKSSDNQAISALAAVAGSDMVSDIAANNLASNIAVSEGSLPTGSVVSQTPNANTVTNTELNSTEMLLKQPGKTSDVIDTSRTQESAPVVDVNDDLVIHKDEVILPNNAEQPRKASELASKLSVETVNQPLSAVLLKPLEAAAGVQQVAMSAENRPVVDTKTADTASKVLQTQQQNFTPASVLQEDTQQSGQGNVATDKKALTNKLADLGDDKAEGSQASFNNVLHQLSKDNLVSSSNSVSQQPAQPMQDPHEVVSQIIDHARLVKGANASEMIIKLKPEHLGELTLKVAVDNGVVSASFHTSNNEVRGIIEASIQQLKHDMAQQGLKVDNVGVYAGMGQLLSDGQGETYKKQEWKSSAKKDNKDDFSEALNVIEAATNTASDSGVDYRI